VENRGPDLVREGVLPVGQMLILRHADGTLVEYIQRRFADWLTRRLLQPSQIAI
jgi:hypothetical protein